MTLTLALSLSLTNPGTTAIVALLNASRVTVACVGDSRCVLGTTSGDLVRVRIKVHMSIYMRARHHER